MSMTMNVNCYDDNDYENNPFQWDKIHGRFYLASKPTLLIRKRQKQRSKNKKETETSHDQTVKDILNEKNKKESKKKFHLNQTSTNHKLSKKIGSQQKDRLLNPWQHNLLVATKSVEIDKTNNKKNIDIRQSKNDPVIYHNCQRRSHTTGSLRPSINKRTNHVENKTLLKTYGKKKSGKKKINKKIPPMSIPVMVEKNDEVKLSPNRNEIIPSSFSMLKAPPKTKSPSSKENFDENELINDDDPVSETDDDMWSWSQGKEEVKEKRIIPIHLELNRSINTPNSNSEEQFNELNENNNTNVNNSHDEWCWEQKDYCNEDKITNLFDSSSHEKEVIRRSESVIKDKDKYNAIDLPLLPLNKKNCDRSSLSDKFDGELTEIHSIHDEEKKKLSFVLDVERARQKAILMKRRSGMNNSKKMINFAEYNLKTVN